MAPSSTSSPLYSPIPSEESPYTPLFDDERDAEAAERGDADREGRSPAQNSLSRLAALTSPHRYPPSHARSNSGQRFHKSRILSNITTRLKVLGRRPILRWLVVGGVLLTLLWIFVVPAPDTWGTGWVADWEAGIGKPKAGVLPLPPLPPVGEGEEDKEGQDESAPGDGPDSGAVEGGGEGQDGSSSSEDLWAARKLQVQQSFQHAWTGYIDKAYPKDELRPLLGAGKDKFNGWSVTLADSLSTLWLMGLHDDFYDAIRKLEGLDLSKNTNDDQYIPFFETVIRYLGGWLSAHALLEDVKDPRAAEARATLLNLSIELGERLLPVFSHSTAPPSSVTQKEMTAEKLAEIAAFAGLDGGIDGMGMAQLKKAAEDKAKADAQAAKPNPNRRIVPLPAFGVRFDNNATQLSGGGGGAPDVAVLAELGSCQLEYKYLAHLMHTNKDSLGTKSALGKEFYSKVENVMTHLYNSTNYDGLFSDRWSLTTGEPVREHYSVGAGVDSVYEYFLKQYLMAGDKHALKQYLQTSNSIIQNLLFLSPTRNLLYVSDLKSPDGPPGAWNTISSFPNNHHEHLSCFLPGMLALGAHTLPDLIAADPSISAEERATTFAFTERQQERHRWAAEGLAYTCYVLYREQKSGLSSDSTRFNIPRVGGQRGTYRQRRWMEAIAEWERSEKGQVSGIKGEKPPGVREPKLVTDDEERDYKNVWPEQWLMRPETVESIYLMYRTTGDPVWRQRGYDIYQAIEKNARTSWGYGSVQYVHTLVGGRVAIQDDMPSYFLAETLKYLYLLFDDSDPLDFDKWVFNTEAHPLKIFKWSEEERRAYGVDY